MHHHSEETRRRQPLAASRPLTHSSSTHRRITFGVLIFTVAITILQLSPFVIGDTLPACPNPPAAGETVNCAAGYYNNNQNCCYPCPVGRASSATNPTSCTECTPGRFTDISGKQACDPCLLGRYNAETGATACAICNAGTFATGPAATQCTLCTATAKNFQPAVNAGSCLATCTAQDYVVSADGIQCKPITGSPATPASPCGDGFYVSADGSACVECPEGSYSIGPNARFCSVCLAGKIAVGTGNSACTSCTAGTYTKSAGTTLCAQCEFGTYSAAQATTCTNCERNTFQPDIGQGSCLPCTGEATTSSCTVCTPGKFLDTTPVTAGTNRCTDCSAGSYSTTSNAGICTFCEIGKAQSSIRQTECLQCNPGYVSSTQGHVTCDPCVAGKYSLTTVGVSSQCTACPPGKYSNDTAADCSVCADGEYQPDSGQAACIVCDNTNGAIPNTNHTTCTVPAPVIIVPQCEFGQSYNAVDNECANCTSGRYSNQRNPSSCTPCERGKYQDLEGKRECVLCPLGKATNFTGQDVCLDCLEGTVASYLGTTICAPCGPGFFQNTTAGEKCQPCAIGYVQNTTGAMKCLPCEPGTIQKDLGFANCLPCEPGMWIDQYAATKCVPCLSGSAVNTTGQPATCPLCSEGTIAPLNGTRVCQSCKEGYYAPSQGLLSCTPCTPGSYANSTASAGCSRCEEQTYQPSAASSACFACVGTVRNDARLCLEPGTIELNITLNMDFTQVTSTPAVQAKFEKDFLSDLAKYSGSNASADRYIILGLSPGSIRVNFAILPPSKTFFNTTTNKTEPANLNGIPSAYEVLQSIKAQLVHSPPLNPSLLLNGSVWSQADNTSLALTITCQNDTTFEIYTLSDGSNCRVTIVEYHEPDIPQESRIVFYSIVTGASILVGCILIAIIFYFCFRKRGVRVRQKRVAQWGVAQPEEPSTEIGEEIPEEEEHVDGVKRHPIRWGY